MNKEKKRKIVAIVKLVILGIILIGIPLYIYLFQRELIKELSNFDNIKGYFEAHKIGMVFFCLLAQCIQIVISIIPGQWIQIGAGYFYGVVVAYGISVIGAILGSVITYYIAKKLGRDAMYLFFKEEQIENLIEISDTGSAKGFVQLCSGTIQYEVQAVPPGFNIRQDAGDDGEYYNRKTALHT